MLHTSQIVLNRSSSDFFRRNVCKLFLLGRGVFTKNKKRDFMLIFLEEGWLQEPVFELLQCIMISQAHVDGFESWLCADPGFLATLVLQVLLD